MKFSRKRLLGILLLLVFVIPLGMAVRKVYREVRQPEMNSRLIAAIKKNDTTTVVSLLREGANPDAGDIPPDPRSFWERLWDSLRGKPLPKGEEAPTALLVALDSKRVISDLENFPPENVPLIRALLDAGANVNASEEDAGTALTVAAESHKNATVRLLVERGAEVNMRDRDNGGCTALDYVASGNDVSLVQLLLARGARVNVGTDDCSTPLHEAASGGNVTILRLLLSKGAKVDAYDQNYDTPLAVAVQQNHLACAKLLIARGAQLNTKNSKFRTALKMAQENHNTQIVKMLKQAGAKE